MRLKKTVALALVTAMAATMAAGCGSSSSDKGSAAPESTAAGSEAAGGEADSKDSSGCSFRNRRAYGGVSGTVWNVWYVCPPSGDVYESGRPGKISGCGSGVY